MSDTPYREPAETTNVCPRCVEWDSRKSAVLAWLSRAATYLLRALLATLMGVHWFVSNDAVETARGSVLAAALGLVGFFMMMGVHCGVAIRDRSLVLFFLATWAIVVSSSWAVVTWSMP